MGDYTFSEHGEDILIHRLLLWKKSGFYVDCGAYHPRKMSLTARLRMFGWTGINIDADSRVIDLFNQQNDSLINVNVAISSGSGVAMLRRYDDPVINTISLKQKEHLDDIDKKGGLLTNKFDDIEVECKSLSQILSEHGVKNVDFLNLDIEGVELDALEGYPWGHLSPLVISCEIHGLDLYNISKNEIVSKLSELGYVLQSYVFHTAIFMRRDFDTEQCHRVAFAVL